MGTLYNVNATTGDVTIAGNVSIQGIVGKLIPIPVIPNARINYGETKYASYSGLFDNELDAVINIPKCRVKLLSVKARYNDLSNGFFVVIRKDYLDAGYSLQVPGGSTSYCVGGCDIPYEALQKFSIKIYTGAGASGQYADLSGGWIWVSI
jgi:hypothetical protein